MEGLINDLKKNLRDIHTTQVSNVISLPAITHSKKEENEDFTGVTSRKWEKVTLLRLV